MTISDWSDEDADNLDDEALMEAYLEIGSAHKDTARQDATRPQVVNLPDWPETTGQIATLTLDPETTAWFQSRHGDWRREISLVLRAWIIATDPSARLGR